jgi:DNA-binding LytR/AlgR family response regulator
MQAPLAPHLAAWMQIDARTLGECATAAKRFPTDSFVPGVNRVEEATNLAVAPPPAGDYDERRGVRRAGGSMQGATALIAEDEATLAEELAETLATLWPQLAIRAVAANGPEAVRLLEKHKPDVLFLDIEMPGMSGLEVARRASRRSHVVFVTAYDRYAVAAFERGAVDYVMKPIEAPRLADTVARLKERLPAAPPDIEDVLQALAQRVTPPREYIRWITASQGRDLRLITTDDVCYFQADNKCTMVVTAAQASPIYRTIRELADALDPSTFWQIHRGTIVNVRHITGITRDYGGRLRLRVRQRTETLAVSGPYAHRFRGM